MPLLYAKNNYYNTIIGVKFVFFKLEEGKPLPSPSLLKGKIIVKNKKLKPEQEYEGEYVVPGK